MKIRTGFVSNSSSSSFVCEVCGRVESGWDGSPSDFDMIECENEHTICLEEMLEDQDSDEDGKYDYRCPERCCPICKFVVFSEKDLARYLLKKHNIPREEVFAEVKKANKRRKKLYDSEYNTYVCTKLGLARDKILEEVKTTFATYREFEDSLRK